MIANVGSTLLSALMEVPAQVDPTQSILSVMRNWMTALGYIWDCSDQLSTGSARPIPRLRRVVLTSSHFRPQ